MKDFNEQNLTDAVLRRLEGASDTRFAAIMSALVRHLHDFVREVELTEAEWLTAIRFLTATGQMCDDKRQEFILLSDTLGVSMLVDAINHRKPQGATESTVLGPFYVADGGKDIPFGGSIADGARGRLAFVQGTVRDTEGRPIEGATLDVWQTDSDGFYDVQRPGGGLYLRGKMRTDARGRYLFRTVEPVSYPIPTDGPVGRMLDRMGRHPYRPAHIHFILTAPGFEPVITHLFKDGDPYLESDAVFAVKSSLVARFETRPPGEAPDGTRVETPFLVATHDFGLKPQQQAA